MSLDPAAFGDALRAAAPEVVRLWRAARAEARPGVFPGLADGVIAQLVERAGEALASGTRDPEAVWSGVVGTVRIDPRLRKPSASELEAEWAILGSVLDAVCSAVAADAAARDFLRAVVGAATSAAADVAHGRPPAGVLVVLALSGTVPARAGTRR